MSRPKVIAVDFDGTLAIDRFPLIGKPNQELIDHLLEEQKNGTKLILWTCRGGSYLDKAIAWCDKQGLKFDAINDDIPEIKNRDFGRNKSVKVFADEYWDDKAIEVRTQVTEMLEKFNNVGE